MSKPIGGQVQADEWTVQFLDCFVEAVGIDVSVERECRDGFLEELGEGLVLLSVFILCNKIQIKSKTL